MKIPSRRRRAGRVSRIETMGYKERARRVEQWGITYRYSTYTVRAVPPPPIEQILSIPPWMAVAIPRTA